MRREFSKQEIMQHYYSDEELRDSLRVSIKKTLRWLEEARLFFSKAVPPKTKKLKERLILEGW